MEKIAPDGHSAIAFELDKPAFNSGFPSSTGPKPAMLDLSQLLSNIATAKMFL